MADAEPAITGADVLVRGLRDHGVRVVFGYPGGPLMPLYDSLYREPALRHVLARDEQAAAFMADGYARASGEAGICLAVCGPGVFNAFTPLATAFTDSVPVLLISGQTPLRGRGVRTGYYHENNQLDASATLTKWRQVIEHPNDIYRLLEQALAAVTDRRPGPALLDVPVDVLSGELPRMPVPLQATIPLPPRAQAADINALAEAVSGWKKPLLLAGGGVISGLAAPLLVQVAERLGAPVFTSLMGKGAIPGDHPLSYGLPWHQATSDLTNMAPFISPLFAEADGVLAVGCRFSQVTTGNWTLPQPRQLIQVDIDKTELARHYPVTLGIQADARQVLRVLHAALPAQPRTSWAAPKPQHPPWRLPGLDLLGPLRRALPRNGIVVADVTQLAYIMLADFPVYEPRTFLHPAGFVSMAYGIPAAIGAKLAKPDRPVVAVVGDGGFLMSGMELATAVQEKVPLVVVLINDRSLSLIRAIQQRRFGSRHLGVDLVNPDFGQFARAFGVACWQVHDDRQFERGLREALDSNAPALIEVVLGGQN
jgi:thiamine pyrophosphate-dependent acetolactate synthase large subunit-like protein